jgi:hypothetical protein
MRKPEKSMVDYFSPYTVTVSRLVVGMLMFLALYTGVRYPIAWLWQHLWKIVESGKGVRSIFLRLEAYATYSFLALAGVRVKKKGPRL